MTLFELRSTKIGGFPSQVLYMALRDRSDRLHHLTQVEEGQLNYQGDCKL
jgi:hypothetical protein